MRERAKRTEGDYDIGIAAKVLLVAALLAPSMLDRGGETHARPGGCPQARHAAVFYRAAWTSWRGRMRLRTPPRPLHGACSEVRRQARVLRALARAARHKWYRWRYLDTRDWQTATRLAERVFPGTADWLMACSSGEGGHGGFVWNTQGSGAGGWLQFMEGTYRSYAAPAAASARRRGFIIRRFGYTEPLGQAITGAYMRTIGVTRTHWAGTPSCA